MWSETQTLTPSDQMPRGSSLAESSSYSATMSRLTSS